MANHDGVHNSAEFREPAPFEVDAQGHRLTIYPGGPERLEALIALIEDARESLKLCFYIYAPDATGRRVRDALVAAARRGVRVTVIVDGFGAQADEAFFAQLSAAGGEFFCFIAKFTRRYLIRNHQKIAIADDRRAMIGGFNIEDSYFTSEANRWADLGMTVEGRIVERISEWFAELKDWISRPRAQFIAIRRKVRGWHGGDGPVQLLIGGPTRGLSSWARCVSRDLIEGERLDMVMAYFSPPRRLQRRIRRLARKGSTRLILAGKSDNAATIAASRALYSRLLRSGARIYEFEPCKLHSKLIVLDDAVYFGSANFDMRSLYLNLEIMLRIEDAGLAARMRELADRYVEGSIEATRTLHRSRASLWNRVRWTASWFLVSVVDYTVSRKLNLGLDRTRSAMGPKRDKR